MTTPQPERRPPLTSPPNPSCLCDWVNQDHGQHVSPVRVREHPKCPVDHEKGRGLLVRKP